MTEYDTSTGAHVPPPADPAGSRPPRDDWDDVKRSLDELGAAMTKWASAVKDDPENRRQAHELKERFETMSKDIGKAIDSAAESDFVRDMSSAAGKAGEAVVDAARTVGREVRPLMATAFRTAAEGMRVVAERVDDSAARRSGTAGDAPAPPAAPPVPGSQASPASHPAPSPYSGEEPPAPAQSGVPGSYEPDPGEH